MSGIEGESSTGRERGAPSEHSADAAVEPERRDFGSGARSALANPDFRRLWLAEAVSQIGDGLTGLAILVVVHRLTGSTTALAIMAILMGIPQLVFGLHAGVIADRVDRRRL